MSLKITSGKAPRAQKVVIYGPEGIGKTTLASKFPDPLFIDIEDGSVHMDVKRISPPSSWTELDGIIQEVAQTPDCCKTLVIDTADAAEKLCNMYVCSKNKWDSIESPGYGKGIVVAAESWGSILASLDMVVRAGINVVVIAHAAMRKFEQPDEMGSYDRWELKLSKKTAAATKEWADCVLFCNYKTYVVKDGDGKNAKGKGRGGKRVIYAQHDPCWDAKNRYGWPAEIEMDYSAFGDVFGAERAKKVTVPQQKAVAPKQTKRAATMVDAANQAKTDEQFEAVKALCVKSSIQPYEVAEVVAVRKPEWGNKAMHEYSLETMAWIIRNWKKIVDMIEALPNRRVPDEDEIIHNMEVPF